MGGLVRTRRGRIARAGFGRSRTRGLGAGLLVCLLAAGTAQAAPRHVRIAVSTTLINVGYPMLTLPLSLGLWRDAGLDVELLPVGGSLQSMQQLVAGNADFAELDSGAVVQAHAKHGLPVRIVMDNGVIDWSVAVPAGSRLHSIADLKGKTIGVFNLATGGIAYFDSALQAAGLQPGRDVDLVPLGLGAPPVQALRYGRVDALLYWAAATATFENAGLHLRRLAGTDWRHYPDFSLVTMQATIERDPKLVEAVARGMAEASVFALANPDCARRLQWARDPSSKPRGADEATLVRWDMNTEAAQLASMRDAQALNGGKYWGRADLAVYGRLIDFMLRTKQIDHPVAASDIVIGLPGFFARINDFDAGAVQRRAAACTS